MGGGNVQRMNERKDKLEKDYVRKKEREKERKK